MQKKKYVAPGAEFVMLAPSEEITSWSWTWGNWKLEQNGQLVTPSVTGTQKIWINPWEHNNSNDPY